MSSEQPESQSLAIVGVVVTAIAIVAIVNRAEFRGAAHVPSAGVELQVGAHSD